MHGLGSVAGRESALSEAARLLESSGADAEIDATAARVGRRRAARTAGDLQSDVGVGVGVGVGVRFVDILGSIAPIADIRRRSIVTCAFPIVGHIVGVDGFDVFPTLSVDVGHRLVSEIDTRIALRTALGALIGGYGRARRAGEQCHPNE